MLDINAIRNNSEEIKKGIARKGRDKKLVDEFLKIDDEWKTYVAERDETRAKQKAAGKNRDITAASELKTKLQTLGEKIGELELKRTTLLRQFPNIPKEDVPDGKDERENKIIAEQGKKPKLKNPKDYLMLTEPYDLIDMARAAKVSGTRFAYLKNEAAWMEFALVQLALDTLTKKGFAPIIPPVLIRKEMMEAMGFIDRKKDQEETYMLENDGLYLVGTAEQAIGPLHAEEILPASELPKRYLAFSTSFRREAGSYGKDTKGILRVHQFDKLEMFSLCKPDASKEEHEFLIACAEELTQKLELPYHLVRLCAGDLSQSSADTYDIETWMPGQNGGKGEYRETHSISNTTDFQSRRLNIKYRDGSETGLVHMLNGTAFAIGRTLIAIFENYQTKEGTIKIPKALRPYMNKQREIKHA